LGAGAHIVRWNGKVYEAIKALAQRRPRCDLYHSALEVTVPEGQFVIEVTPIPDQRGAERGVVAEGAVGTGGAGRFRLFRYEIRRWRGGSIPDASEAVESPVCVTTDRECAQRILDLVPFVRTPVWGRDELDTGDMWNFQLRDLVVAGPRQSGDRRDPPAVRWASAGVGRGSRGRAARHASASRAREAAAGVGPFGSLS